MCAGIRCKYCIIDEVYVVHVKIVQMCCLVHTDPFYFSGLSINCTEIATE